MPFYMKMMVGRGSVPATLRQRRREFGVGTEPRPTVTIFMLRCDLSSLDVARQYT